jgi:hypothetical protein
LLDGADQMAGQRRKLCRGGVEVGPFAVGERGVEFEIGLPDLIDQGAQRRNRGGDR